MDAMLDLFVKTAVTAFELYSVGGVVFALIFVAEGVQRIDTEAIGAPVIFRILIVPGVAALWPIFLDRWYRGIEPPTEVNPHR